MILQLTKTGSVIFLLCALSSIQGKHLIYINIVGFHNHLYAWHGHHEYLLQVLKPTVQMLQISQEYLLHQC